MSDDTPDWYSSADDGAAEERSGGDEDYVELANGTFVKRREISHASYELANGLVVGRGTPTDADESDAATRSGDSNDDGRPNWWPE